MRARSLPVVLLSVAACAVAPSVFAAPPNANETVKAASDLFAAKIRPVLTDVCLQCHGGAKPENGLRLESRAALLRGGEAGPAIVPGTPDESLLVKAIRQSSDLQMPPDGKLPDDTIKAFEEWIRGGAEWSGGDLI